MPPESDAHMLTCKQPWAATPQTRSPPSACSLHNRRNIFFNVPPFGVASTYRAVLNFWLNTLCSAPKLACAPTHQQAELQFPTGLHLKALATVARWQHLCTPR